MYQCLLLHISTFPTILEIFYSFYIQKHLCLIFSSRQVRRTNQNEWMAHVYMVHPKQQLYGLYEFSPGLLPESMNIMRLRISRQAKC